MKYEELVSEIAGHSGESKATVGRVLKSLTRVTHANLKLSNEIAIPDLGKFKLAVRAAHNSRNPRTGENISVPDKNAVKFSAAKALKDSVN